MPGKVLAFAHLQIEPPTYFHAESRLAKRAPADSMPCLIGRG